MQHHCHCRTWSGGECSCNEAEVHLPQTQQATLRFHYNAGALIRRAIKDELMGAAFTMGATIDIQESKGLLDSTCYVTVKGDSEKIITLKNAIERYFYSIAEEE